MREEMDGDLEDRLTLIERMLAEGRKTTERWSWAFVLWGAAYYVAIAWAAWGPKGQWSWPVTMVAASIATAVLATKMPHDGAHTLIGRAIAAVWISMGIAMFTLLGALGTSGRFEPHLFVALVAAMLGTANAASGTILKWRLQLACAVVWWVTAAAACFAADALVIPLFAVAIFFCQIAFGVFGMIAESRQMHDGEARA